VTTTSHERIARFDKTSLVFARRVHPVHQYCY
jgi:hypothetical protein